MNDRRHLFLFAILSVLVAIMCLQTGASLAKQLFPLVGAPGATALRLGIAAVLLLLVFRPWRQWPARADWPLLVAYGGCVGVMNLLFYLSLTRIPLGVAVALEFAGPLALAVYSSRQPCDLIWVGCAIAGLLCLLPLDAAQVALDPLGMALALGAGLCWSGYIVTGRRVSMRLPSGVAVSCGALVAALLVAPMGIAQAGEALLAWNILPLALGVALLSSALPYVLEMRALKHLPTYTFSILMSLEPAVAAMSGWLLLSENLTPLQLLAIGLVMLASIGSAVGIKGR